MKITELLTEARLAGKFTVGCTFARSFKFDGPGTAQQEAVVADAVKRLEQLANELNFRMESRGKLQDKHSLQFWFITSPHMSSFKSVASKGLEFENFANDLLTEIKNSISDFTGWLNIYISYLASNGVYHALIEPSKTVSFLDGEVSLFDLLDGVDAFKKIDPSEIIQDDV
jgi:hypothetical protein